MNDVNTREAIVKGLKSYLNIPVIRSNQTGDIPKYPYVSYTITGDTTNGTWGAYEDQVDRKPYIEHWSITAQSDNYSESLEIARKTRDWIDRIGTTELNDQHVFVNKVGGISPRDNLITVEYEHRNGFDFDVACSREVPSTITDTGYIETVELEDKNNGE